MAREVRKRILFPEMERKIAAWVTTKRQDAGLRQVDVAQRLGISHQQFYKYETGENRMSAGAVVTFIAELGLDPAELVALCLGPQPERQPPIDPRLLAQIRTLSRDGQKALAALLSAVT